MYTYAHASVHTNMCTHTCGNTSMHVKQTYAKEYRFKFQWSVLQKYGINYLQILVNVTSACHRLLPHEMEGLLHKQRKWCRMYVSSAQRSCSFEFRLARLVVWRDQWRMRTSSNKPMETKAHRYLSATYWGKSWCSALYSGNDNSLGWETVELGGNQPWS